MAKVEIHERSYGIIPLRLNAGLSAVAAPNTRNTQVLLIHQKTQCPNLDKYWTFPKGHPEKTDPSIKHSAIRELKEETGLSIGLDDILDLEIVFQEVFLNPITQVNKAVRFWPAMIRGEQKIEMQEQEIADSRWCTWEQALQLLTFDDTKEILVNVAQLLDPDHLLNVGTSKNGTLSP